MLEKGHLHLGLRSSATPVSTSHDVDVDMRQYPNEFSHDQSIVTGEMRLSAEYPFVDEWAAALYLPVRFYWSQTRFRDQQGDAFTPPEESIHHRDGTLVGPGDPWLLARHAWPVGSWQFDAQAGLTLPLGRTEENPFTPEKHQHVQFGTGTFNPVAGLGARYQFSRWSPGVWGLAVIVPSENSKGYRAGDRFAGGANAMVSLARWLLRLGVHAQREQAEHWDGTADTEDGNRGRFDLMADLGASVNMAEGWSVSAGVKVPFYTKVVGAQLDYPAIFDLGLSGTFEIGGEDHHGHAHHDPEDHAVPAGKAAVDWTGLDVVEIAPNGEATDLVSVPGRVTVFDFWASWCEPCRDLDRALVDLMRRHPGRIAVRKLRVETWETPAARRYLGDAPALPYVKVTDAEGREAFSLGGDPAEMVKAIEGLLVR